MCVLLHKIARLDLELIDDSSGHALQSNVGNKTRVTLVPSL